MTASPLRSVVRCLSRLPAELSDAELLDRFGRDGEDAAFTLLVQRHGPAVLGVCRRLLGNAADADDAFQATFLVLLRNASTVRHGSALGCWLHGVACRVAAKARARRTLSPLVGDTFAAAGVGPDGEAAFRELVALLDEEVRRLPEKYRTALILCGLEGKTCEQSARELGWPKSTVAHRLTRARELLRRRLLRQGVVVPAALLSVTLAKEAAASYVPALLALATVRLARQAAAGRLADGPAVALAEEVAKKVSVRWAVVLGLAAVGLAAAAAASRQDKEPAPEPPAAPVTAAASAAHVDREGFALPAEALARIGSARFRHGQRVWNLDYSPEGSLLASSGNGLVRVWDSGTGNLVWQHTVADPRFARDGHFSADGKSVVVVDGETCRWLDARTGREVRACAIKLPKDHFGRLGARGALLAVTPEATGNGLVMHELPSGRERFRIDFKATGFGEIVFSPDGTTLAALERVAPRIFQIRFVDTATGRSLGAFDPGGLVRCLAFSPDGKKLLAHDCKSKLTVWSVPNGEVLHRLDVEVNFLLGAAFAPDGQSVVVENKGGLDAVQVELSTGRELHRFRTHPSDPPIAFTADGQRMAITSVTGCISQWDIATGRRLSASVDSVMGCQLLRFDATGRALELWNGGLTAVEWRTGRETWRMPMPEGGIDYQLAVSPDRSRVAGSNNADKKIAIWDTASGKRLWVLPENTSWSPSAFSADGKTLYTAGFDNGPIHGWDTSTGKELPAFEKEQRSVRGLAVSPDGRWLAAADHPPALGGGSEIVVWDRVAGGKPRCFLPRPERMQIGDLAFSPDGSRLAAVGGDPRHRDEDGFVGVWDVVTGEEKVVRPAPKGELLGVHYSADGRLLVTNGSDNSIRLWEVATGQERHRFTGHESRPYCEVFSPDGKLVASSGFDAPVFVWDVEGCYGKSPLATPFSEREAKSLWDALDGADASAAFDAIRQLLARPGPTVALLRQRLRPAPAADEKALRRLLDDLDADDFTAREKASRDLEAVADRAAPMLRKALAGNPSAESKRRIEHILEAAAPAAPQRRREVRAVEVLERLGTAAARELLESLAGGDQEAILTRETCSAAKRLK